MSTWIERAKDQLETHASTLHALVAISKIAKKALVDPGTDTYAVIQVIEKIADVLIDGFASGGKVSEEEIAKYLDSVIKSEETVNASADRAFEEKFGEKL